MSILQHSNFISRLVCFCCRRGIPEGTVVVVAPWADLEDSLRVGGKANLLLISLDGEINFKSGK